MSKDRIRILIAAGGTGGHLLPALEVAKALEQNKNLAPGILRIEFVGVGRPVESAILAEQGFNTHTISSLGLKGKGLSGIFDFIKLFPSSYSQARELIKSFNPDVVVGFGGYPSVLPVLAAYFSGIPTWIHEADSSPGWATKFLSLFASKVSSGFEDITLPFGRKSIFTGHPVRSGLAAAIKPSENFVPTNILVLGGSQGSAALDAAVPKVLAGFDKRSIQIRHQCRANNTSKVLESYQVNGLRAEVNAYISDMISAYQQADIVISRAGAGAVMELSVLNKPVIFVPLPHVSGHQLKNAKTLEKAGKALIIPEGDNFELRLADALEYLQDPKVYHEISARPVSHRNIDAAERIAEGILELITHDWI